MAGPAQQPGAGGGEVEGGTAGVVVEVDDPQPEERAGEEGGDGIFVFAPGLVEKSARIAQAQVLDEGGKGVRSAVGGGRQLVGEDGAGSRAERGPGEAVGEGEGG